MGRDGAEPDDAGRIEPAQGDAGSGGAGARRRRWARPRIDRATAKKDAVAGLVLGDDNIYRGGEWIGTAVRRAYDDARELQGR